MIFILIFCRHYIIFIRSVKLELSGMFLWNRPLKIIDISILIYYYIYAYHLYYFQEGKNGKNKKIRTSLAKREIRR